MGLWDFHCDKSKKNADNYSWKKMKWRLRYKICFAEVSLLIFIPIQPLLKALFK